MSNLKNHYIETSYGSIFCQSNNVNNGPKYIFVHGLISSSIVWNPIKDHLAKENINFIIFDLFSRGKSSKSSHKHNIETYAKQLLEVFNYFDITSEDKLVGLSWGCCLITYLYNQRPEESQITYPGHLYFLAPGGVLSFKNLSLFVLKIPVLGKAIINNSSDSWLYKDFLSCFHKPDVHTLFYKLQKEEIDKNNYFKDSFIENVLTSPVFFLYGFYKLKQKNIRLNILWGAKDKKSPYKYNKLFFNFLQINVKLIDNCGHMIPWESPENTIKYLKDEM